jgi:hypothetical protein
VRRQPDTAADGLTLWCEAQRAHRSLYAMVGLSRTLPPELCWTILGLLDLVTLPPWNPRGYAVQEIWAEN